jgi:hypothetical protein
VKRIVFISYVYGRHIKYLLNYALPSLLIENNLADLQSRYDIRFHFACDAAAKIKICRYFKNLNSNFLIKFTQFRLSKKLSPDSKIRKMALHHALLVKEATKLGAIVAPIYPESFFCAGTIAEMLKTWEIGYSAAVIPAFRSFQFSKIDKIFGKDNKIPSRKVLIKRIIRNLHPEMKSQIISSNKNFSNCCCLIKIFQDSILLNNSTWDPLFFDSAKMHHVDWQLEKERSLDDGIVFNTFSSEKIYVCYNNPRIGYFGFSDDKLRDKDFRMLSQKIRSNEIKKLGEQIKNIYPRIFGDKNILRDCATRKKLLWKTGVISSSSHDSAWIYRHGGELRRMLWLSKYLGFLKKDRVREIALYILNLIKNNILSFQ